MNDKTDAGCLRGSAPEPRGFIALWPKAGGTCLWQQLGAVMILQGVASKHWPILRSSPHSIPCVRLLCATFSSSLSGSLNKSFSYFEKKHYDSRASITITAILVYDK